MPDASSLFDRAKASRIMFYVLNRYPVTVCLVFHLHCCKCIALGHVYEDFDGYIILFRSSNPDYSEL